MQYSPDGAKIRRWREERCMGGEHLVMRWPIIWWTVGVSGHALTVAIVELVGRFHRERGA